MIILAILFITIVFSFTKVSKYTKSWACVFPFLLMMLVCGLRGDDIGRDSENYIRGYYYVEGTKEPLFDLLSKLCYLLGFEWPAFFFVIALLTYILLAKFVKDNSENCGVSAILFMTFSVYFFYNTFNVLRMMLAAAILLNALSYLQSRQNVKFALVSILAVGIHYSAIAIVLIFIIIRLFKSFPGYFIYISLILTICFGLLSSSLLPLLNVFDLIFSSVEFNKAASYSTYLSDYQEQTLNLAGKLVVLGPTSVYVILAYKKSQTLFYKSFFVGVLISNLFISTLYYYRVTTYLWLPLIVEIPNSYINAKIIKKMIYNIMFAFLVIWFIYNILTEGLTAQVIPYRFFFE